MSAGAASSARDEGLCLGVRRSELARLTEKYRTFIRGRALRYSGRAFDEDAVQEATLGFLRGVSNWSKRGQGSVLTYADIWIRNHVSDHNRSSTLVKGPTHVPIKAACDVCRDALTTAANDPTGQESPSPEELFFESESKRWASSVIAEAMTKLTPNEQTVIRLRYLSEPRATFVQAGAAIGMSHARAHQLEVSAIDKMRLHIIHARKQAA